MKKFIKICLITGCICFGVGLITIAVGAFNIDNISGHTAVIIEKMPFHGLGRWTGNIIKGHVEFDDDRSWIEEDTDPADDDFVYDDKDDHHKGHKHHSKRGYTSIGTEELSLEGINKIEINSQGNELILEGRSDLKGIKTEVDYNGLVSYKIDEDELKINIGKCYGDEVYLYLPENVENYEVELELQGCDFNAKNITAKDINMEARGCNVIFSGSVSERIDIESMGAKMYIELSDSIEEYDIDVECNAGTVVIDENEFSGLSVEREIKRGNNKYLNVECDAGDIEITGATSI